VTYFDAAALWVIWWCSIAGLITSKQAQDVRTLVQSVAMLGTMVFSFIGAIAVGSEAYRPAWWQSGLFQSSALVALWLYDARFGLGRHARMVREWVSRIVTRSHA
jgi:hypothetical protein